MTLYVGSQKICVTNNTGHKLTDYLNLGTVVFDVYTSYVEDGGGVNYIQIDNINIADYGIMEVVTGKSFVNSPYDLQINGYTWTSDDTTLSLPVYVDISTDYTEIDDGAGGMYRQLMYPFAIVGYGYVEDLSSGMSEYKLGIYISNHYINSSLLALGSGGVYLFDGGSA